MSDGVALSTYEPGALRKVPAHLGRKPLKSFDLAERLGERVSDWVRDRYGEAGADLADIAHSIPMEVYKLLTVDELCKVRFASRFMMDGSVEDAFKEDPRLSIFRKIVSSMWRWGVGRGDWNEIVDVYEGIRKFDLGHPDLEARLDHSTSFNECGYAEHSRTFLDGVFGFLVHHKGRHVMTLGFSVMSGRRLLLQQVQLKDRKGNRWLFKLPRNYLEHVVDRFQASFPRHTLFLVDGRQITSKSLNSYRDALVHAEKREAEARRKMDVGSPEDRAYRTRAAESYAEDAERLRTSISHLEAEVERLAAFYDGVGRFRFGRTIKVNHLEHREMAGP